MKKIDITTFGIAIQKEQIESFESFIKAKLPKEYIQFLIKHNGGILGKEDAYPIKESEKFGFEFDGIEYFFGLGIKEVSDLKEQFLVFQERIPKDLIPIGHAPCGNLVCLAVLGKNYGKVYFWDHEREVEEGEEPTYDNVYLIANSFEEFIDSLYEQKV